MRRINLQRLIEKEGSIKAFADKVGTDASYISAILSEKIQRNAGDELMRRVEVSYKLPSGSLDFPDEGSMYAAMAAEALPENDRQQVFDFIRYKIEHAGPLVASQEVVARYLRWVDDQVEHMKRLKNGKA